MTAPDNARYRERCESSIPNAVCFMGSKTREMIVRCSLPTDHLGAHRCDDVAPALFFWSDAR